MIGTRKNGNILSFFKPKEPSATSAKRPLEDSTIEHLRGRSKSPKISREQSSPLPLRSSPQVKRVGLPPIECAPTLCSEDSSALSSLTSTDSDIDDTIVLAPKPPVSERAIEANRSFASVHSTSSRRTDIYGTSFIVDSDEGSDNDVLDLDELLGRKGPVIKPAPEIITSTTLGKPSRRSRTTKFVDTSRDDEVTFTKLMEQTKQDTAKHNETKKVFEAAQAAIAKLDDSEASNDNERSNKRLTAEDVLARIVQDDIEKRHKFAQAMERIELTNSTPQWSFFSEDPLRSRTNHLEAPNSLPNDPASRYNTYETQSLNLEDDEPAGECFDHKTRRHCGRPATSEFEALSQKYSFCCNHGNGKLKVNEGQDAHEKTTSQVGNPSWSDLELPPGWSSIQNATDRYFALISGAFTQAAIDQVLPQSMYQCVLWEFVNGADNSVIEAYESLLTHSGTKLSSDDIFICLRTQLQELGAKSEAINANEPIQQTTIPASRLPPIHVNRTQLRKWMRLASTTAQFLSIKHRQDLLDWLLTMTLDAAIPLDATLLIELQGIIARIIELFPADKDGTKAISNSLKRLYNKANDPHLRLHSLTTMPTTTRKLKTIRRRFAIASFFEDMSHIDSATSSKLLETVRKYLTADEQFRMTKKTDYQQLVSRLRCLNIAIGDGDRPITKDHGAIKDFNAMVDQLADTIRTKYAKIQVTGAAHISRTEAKDILERIEQRLRLAVRTERKKRKTIYDRQSSITETFKTTNVAARQDSPDNSATDE